MYGFTKNILEVTLILLFILIFVFADSIEILSGNRWQFLAVSGLICVIGIVAVLNVKTIIIRSSHLIALGFTILGMLIIGLKLCLLIFAWFIFFLFQDGKPTRILWLGILLIGMYEAITGIFQYFHLIVQGIFPVTGHFDNPAGFAAFLTAILPFTFLPIGSKKCFTQWGGILIAAVLESAICLSGSRSGILASCIIILLGLWNKYGRHTFKIPFFLKWILIGIIISGILTGLYCLKKDSARGRLLIWRVSWEMVKDHPISGHGYGSFQAKYMEYQAEYLKKHPDSEYAYLASDVKVPFNEYLKWIVEFGIPGGMGMLFLCLWLWKEYIHLPDDQKRIALLSILGIAIFAFFSYPLHFSAVLFILVLDLTILCKNSFQYLVIKNGPIVKGSILFIWIYALLLLLRTYKCETELYRLSKLPVQEIQKDQYENLRKDMFCNYVFLYNYGAYLNKTSCYTESINLLNECSRYFNNSELQLFLADNYIHLGNYTKAADYTDKAFHMVPSRFYPLYYKFLIACNIDDQELAISIAEQIVNKKVKIMNDEVRIIKAKMEFFLRQNKGSE